MSRPKKQSRRDASPIRTGRLDDIAREVTTYVRRQACQPVFLNGDCREVMEALPADTFDCCMTSPPYWQKRQYESGGIGLEDDHRNFITEILRVTEQVRRVLKPSGSFWLNMGDSYENKRLLGLPWRVALRMCDEQGWILRSQVVWNKIKGGPDNSPDRLRNVHEPIFHFVKSPKYFFDADAVRSAPRQTKVVNGAVVSATGVSGVRYRRQIELSTDLSSEEKERAMAALDALLDEVRQGRCADFRMVIRRQQRATHSDSESLSGRAKELATKGFYFLRYHPNGAKPSDVWDILPEDTHREDEHFAPYPEDLCRIPILSTCPKDGLVLDPFCGTGTTNLAAYHLGRKSVGIDLSRAYLEKAAKRCGRIPATSSRRLPGSGCGRDPTV